MSYRIQRVLYNSGSEAGYLRRGLLIKQISNSFWIPMGFILSFIRFLLAKLRFENNKKCNFYKKSWNFRKINQLWPRFSAPGFRNFTRRIITVELLIINVFDFDISRKTVSGLYHIYSDYFKQIILNVFKYQLRHISWQQRFDLTRS